MWYVSFHLTLAGSGIIYHIFDLLSQVKLVWKYLVIILIVYSNNPNIICTLTDITVLENHLHYGIFCHKFVSS